MIAAGFTTDQNQAMLDAARIHLMCIIGPNCLGFLSTVHGINDSFSHMVPIKRRLAFLSQPGVIATSIIDWANGNGVGFSHLVSMGDMADVDFCDLPDFLAKGADTYAIPRYAESITAARKFMSAKRIAENAKPAIAPKAGGSTAAAKAAASHTGGSCAGQLVYWHCSRSAPMLSVPKRHHFQCRSGSLVSAARCRLLPPQAFDRFFVCAGSATNRREISPVVASLRPIQQSSNLRREFRRRYPQATHSAVAAAPQCRHPKRTGR